MRRITLSERVLSFIIKLTKTAKGYFVLAIYMIFSTVFMWLIVPRNQVPLFAIMILTVIFSLLGIVFFVLGLKRLKG